MKKLSKILLGVVGVIVVAFAAVMFFTADMVRSADEFFLAVKGKDMDKAYTYLSEDFQQNTSQLDLESYLEKNTLNKFKEASWGSRSVSGGRGSLVGSITIQSGGVVPITLSFVKGDGGWKIYSIQKPTSGIQEESAVVEVPTEAEQVKLVADAMSIFAQSVNEKSMAKFHAHVSNLWQKQVTVESLDDIFVSFYDLGANLTVLNNFSPQFSAKPSIDENGVLSIAGHYPTEPSKVYFEQDYIYEGLGWKLIGFSAEIK